MSLPGVKPEASAVMSVPPSTSPNASTVRRVGTRSRSAAARSAKLGSMSSVSTSASSMHVRVVIQRAQRMQRRRAAAGHLVGAHREEHFRPVRREHRDPAALGQPDLGERLA